jgi:acyl carrier protein
MHITTEQRVKNALVSALNLKNDRVISMQSYLKQDLQLDSMSSIMFLMRLEETIDGFFVDPETLEMRDLETVESIVRYVDMQLITNDSHVH